MAVLEPLPSIVRGSDGDRLAVLEAIVGRGLATFVDVGLALAEIRDRGLFLATHETFKAYLEGWQFSAAWAYGQIYAARCAEAIGTAYELPPGLTADALRPLVPLLNRKGADAVAAAWAPIAERYAGRTRPPSRGEIRAALVEQGKATTAAEKPKPVQLATIEAGLIAADERLAVLAERAPLSPAQRERAACCAGIARRLVAGLEALADASAARAALAALEPLPEGDLCVGHGAIRDPDGLCLRCKRVDVPLAHERR